LLHLCEYYVTDFSFWECSVGVSEFEIEGFGKYWSMLNEIHKIKVPTLIINGTDEGASDEAIKPFFLGIDKVRWVKFAESTHLAHWEEREHFMKIVGDFLLS
jgi:pimeloyl-ACP methyl ester carboxylesterase